MEVRQSGASCPDRFGPAEAGQGTPLCLLPRQRAHIAALAPVTTTFSVAGIFATVATSEACTRPLFSSRTARLHNDAVSLIQRPYAISCMATGGEWVHVPLEADIGGRMDPVFYMQHDHVAPTHRVSESLPRIETLTLTPALTVASP